MALSLNGTAYMRTVPKSTNFKTDPLKHWSGSTTCCCGMPEHPPWDLQAAISR